MSIGPAARACGRRIGLLLIGPERREVRGFFGRQGLAFHRDVLPDVIGDTELRQVAHELHEGVAEADRIDPAECRRAVEERFSPPTLVANYLRAFRAALARTAEPRSRRGSAGDA